ncbi:SMI1/KNR4 family protein [Leptolyngbya sp. FACHB-261]|uniref:SMI1/KNR4 family protein n=1 Tax=Leptolyngbya sp. FACHB-261 TaxID=2692806 RepID=UPI00168951FF|nr:SMI1/KNR4 family protein [Leptolyngbya sp. FACHB-261]MBD2101360.1 SMI1/KNR4 family protein [Leptolyngbya sp. FACHB-261]
METLAQALDKLTVWMQAHNPAWVAALLPGISDEQIDEIAQPLLPYRLPEAAYTLYRWHNGQDWSEEFLPSYNFLPLEQAVEEYQQMLEFEREGWNPLWFPLLSFEADQLVVVCSAQQASLPVLFSPSEDPEIYLWHNSLEAMIHTVLGCYREGAYLKADNYWQQTELEEAIRRRYSPDAYSFKDELRSQMVEGRNFHSKFATHRWPSEWQQAIGRSEASYQPVGASITIAEFQAQAEPVASGTVVLQGKVVELMGSSDFSLVTFADHTGQLSVKCYLPWCRELRIRDCFEIEIQTVAQPGGEFITTQVKLLQERVN